MLYCKKGQQFCLLEGSGQALQSKTFSKHLCMTDLEVQLLEYSHHHFFDATAGKQNSSFGYIEKGSVVLHSLHNTITVPEGSLFFIPDGARYHAVWTGTPEIKQYCFNIIQRKFDLSADSYHPLQRIDALSTPETGELFQRIYQLFATQNRISQLEGLSLYYQFYAKTLPLLQVETATPYSPGVRAAVQYIEANYREDFSMEQLAAACYISPSTLYHRFKKELNSSPVQFRNEIRIEKAAAELKNSDLSIQEIALQNGFHSTTYFFEVFKSHSGLTPAEYRKMLHP